MTITQEARQRANAPGRDSRSTTSMSDTELTRGWPDLFRARAKYKRVHAAALRESVSPGDRYFNDAQQDSAMWEAEGLELAADRLEEEGR